MNSYIVPVYVHVYAVDAQDAQAMTADWSERARDYTAAFGEEGPNECFIGQLSEITCEDPEPDDGP